MRRWLISFILLLLPVVALAVPQPVTFARGTVLVLPSVPKDASNQGGVLFNVDIRDFGSVHNPAWFDFAGLAENKGLLLTQAFSAPVTIAPVNHFAKLDILLLDDYGTILKILPNIALAELGEPVASGVPVLAVLYLKGGMVDALGVQPGDSVRYKLFRKHPEIRSIETPTKPEVEAPKPPQPLKPAPVSNTNLTLKDAAPEAEKPAENNKENALIDLILNRHHEK
jgi:uncharacterized membrane protein (UPF0127 family)